MKSVQNIKIKCMFYTEKLLKMIAEAWQFITELDQVSQGRSDLIIREDRKTDGVCALAHM